MKVTLGNTCIIDLEKKSCWAPYIKKLIQMHKQGRISLQVVAISASENPPRGTRPISNFKQFQKKIEQLGLTNVEILPSILYWGVTFWGYHIWGGEELDRLEKEIQKVLFPRIEIQYPDFCKKRGLKENDAKAWHDWVNCKCDVLALLSHIWYKGDIFVTRDDNYLKEKKPSLLALGAGEILRPEEAITKLR